MRVIIGTNPAGIHLWSWKAPHSELAGDLGVAQRLLRRQLIPVIQGKELLSYQIEVSTVRLQ